MRKKRYRGRRTAKRMGGGKLLILSIFFLMVSGFGVFSMTGGLPGVEKKLSGEVIGQNAVERTFPSASGNSMPSRGSGQARSTSAAAAGSSSLGMEPGSSQGSDSGEATESGRESGLFHRMIGAVFPAVDAEHSEGKKVADAGEPDAADKNEESTKRAAEAKEQAAKQAAEEEAARQAAEAAKAQQEQAASAAQSQLTPQVIIYHTHATESYLPVDEGNFHSLGETGTVREVGDVMTAALQAKGIGVIHNKTIHDSPSYNQSYSRSLSTIKQLLADHPTVNVVIDLHRDAAGYSGGAGKTVNINGEEAARFSLVVGKGNPNYSKLNAFANQIVSKANAMYPGFAGKVIPKEYKYNEYVADQYILLEIGNNENTIDQVKATGKYFADVLEAVLKNGQ